MTLLFIFDMDDVLYEYDWRARMAAMSELTGLSFLELRRLWWHDEGEFGAEAGLYKTGEEYLAAFELAIGQSVDVARWVEIRAAAMTVWPDSLAAAQRAAELGRTTLLTNNGALLGDHLPTLAPETCPDFWPITLRTVESLMGPRKAQILPWFDPHPFEALRGSKPPKTHFFPLKDLGKEKWSNLRLQRTLENSPKAI